MNETVITSIAEFHEQLGQLKHKDAVYLYRGQADVTWPVDCSAARRLTKNSVIKTQLIRHLLVGYLDILISTTRMRGFLPPDFNESISDLELLAHLQHQGAATGLIDFTRHPLVALWFACHESLDTDGAIYVLDRSQTVEISKREDLRDKTIQSIYAEDTLWSWEPSALGNRIVAQSSVFVLGVPEIAQDKWKKIIVRKGSKSDILTQLETMYGINEEELFADFPGYAVANASTKTFDVKRAIRYWQEQIELASDEREKATAHHNCGVAYDAIKDVKNAIEQYSEAIDRNPDFVEAYNNRGLAKDSRCEYNDAISDYTKAIDLNPKLAEVYNNLGKVYHSQDKHDQAIKDYNKAIELNPNFAEAYYNRGNVKNSLQEYKNAIKDYTKAIERNPNLAEAYNNRGTAKKNRCQHEEAIEDYNKAIQLNSHYVDAYSKRGITYCKINRLDKAQRDFERVRDLAQQAGNNDLAKQAKEQLRIPLAEAYFKSGFKQDSLCQHEKAITDYTEAIQLNPNFVDAYYNRGIVNHVLNRLDEARRDFKKAHDLAQQADNEDLAKQAEMLRIPLADAYCRRGHDTLALHCLDKTRRNFETARHLARQAGNEDLAVLAEEQLCTPLAIAYFNRGHVTLALNCPDEARWNFETARDLAQQAGKEDLAVLAEEQLRTPLAQAYYNRGSVSFALNRPDEARRDLETARTLAQQIGDEVLAKQAEEQLRTPLAEAYFRRGHVTLALNRPDEARRDLETARTLAQQIGNEVLAKQAEEQLRIPLAEAYFHRGIINLTLNQPDEARRDFKKARALAQQAGKEDLVALADQNLRNLDAPDEGE